MDTTTDIFLHIHKTGGTTIKAILDHIYAGKNIYNIDGTRFRKSVIQLQNKTNCELNKLHLVSGHQFYGIHECFSNSCTYFAFLREPISRIISLYNFLIEIDLYKEINKNNLNLIEFIESGLVPAADNGMVRMIAGIDVKDISYGKCNQQIYNTAIENINEKFAFVGLTEHFDLSLLVFKELLNWEKTPLYYKRNQTKIKRLTTRNISGQELIKIKEFLKYDIRLYNHIKRNFSKNAVKVLGRNHKKKLNSFQKKLWLYQQKEKISVIVKQKIKRFNS